MSGDPDPQPSYGRKALVLALAASQMGFVVVGGFLLGMWADRYFGSAPWLSILGLVAGFASGLRVMILLAKSQNASQKRN